jgi:ADP-heptose:LPS heptosyltransferase
MKEAGRERSTLRTEDGFAVVAGAPLLTAAAVMGESAVVLGGDTGLMHATVAMGKRVVMVMNWAGPGNSYPFGHREWALVPEPGKGLGALEVERVWRSVVDGC